MSAKIKGRPLSDNPKDGIIKIRADQETLRKLEFSAKALNTTLSAIVRQGIEKVYDDLQK